MRFGQLGFDHFRVFAVSDGGSGGYGGSGGRDEGSGGAGSSDGGSNAELKMEGSGGSQRAKNERERREMGEKIYNFRTYYFIMQIYYFNEQKRKIKVWDAGSIVKWYGIMIK